MYVDFQSYTSIEALHNKYNIYFPEQKIIQILLGLKAL